MGICIFSLFACEAEIQKPEEKLFSSGIELVLVTKVVEGNYSEHFFYNGKNLLYKIEKYKGEQLESTNIYSYSDKDSPNMLRQYLPSGELDTYIKYRWEEEQLIEVYYYYDSYYDDWTSSHDAYYTYNSDGALTYLRLFDSEYQTFGEYYLSWENGNLSKVEVFWHPDLIEYKRKSFDLLNSKEGNKTILKSGAADLIHVMSISYTYDDKKNAFRTFSNGSTYIPLGYNNLYNYSKNNQLSITIEKLNRVPEVLTFSYEYNSDGYPTTFSVNHSEFGSYNGAFEYIKADK